ncbi:MAG: hypothetical protein PWP23_1960 [Candidatus Sumerlaeota bacterium]|nr:hypothetical protein [Candidatus Sumerlaeota bacterium]
MYKSGSNVSRQSPPTGRSTGRKIAIGCGIVVLAGCVVGMLLAVAAMFLPGAASVELPAGISLPGLQTPAPSPTPAQDVVITNENINELLGREVVPEEEAGTVKLLPSGGVTLDVGMTEQQVRDILGRPKSIQRVATNEPERTGGMVSWIYERETVMNGKRTSRTVTVVFRDGVMIDVVGLQRLDAPAGTGS